MCFARNSRSRRQKFDQKYHARSSFVVKDVNEMDGEKSTAFSEHLWRKIDRTRVSQPREKIAQLFWSEKETLW